MNALELMEKLKRVSADAEVKVLFEGTSDITESDDVIDCFSVSSERKELDGFYLVRN